MHFCGLVRRALKLNNFLRVKKGKIGDLLDLHIFSVASLLLHTINRGFNKH